MDDELELVRCPCCKALYPDGEGFESELLGEFFCSEECLDDMEADHRETVAHHRYESHSSNYI
jgi:hypothetical protein